MKLVHLSGVAATVMVAGLALWGSITPASATTNCPTGAGTNYSAYSPNPPGTLASITCTTDGVQFSNFNFDNPTSAGGALLPTPASTAVSVIDVPGNPGFSFNPGFTEAPGESQDATITFEVTAPAGDMITDLSLVFNGSFTGDGSTSFSEEYCTTGFGTGVCNTFEVTNPPSMLTDTIDITPTSTLFITKDYGASGGTDGSASISLIQNQFSVPAPPIGHGLPVLLAIGGMLFGIRLWNRGKKRFSSGISGSHAAA